MGGGKPGPEHAGLRFGSFEQYSARGSSAASAAGCSRDLPVLGQDRKDCRAAADLATLHSKPAWRPPPPPGSQTSLRARDCAGREDRGTPRARPRAPARRPLSPAAAAACTCDPLARRRAAAASAAAALPGLCHCTQRRFPPMTRGRPPPPALVGGDAGDKEMLLSCSHAATWHAAAESAAAAPLELCHAVMRQGPLLAH